MIPHEKQRLEKVLHALNLPEGQWALSGSGVLVLHGIERNRPMGDVDIFLATRPWFDLFFRSINPAQLHVPVAKPWQIFTTIPEDPKRRMDPPYLYKEMHGIEVNVFHQWRQRNIGDIDTAHWVNNAEKVQGWPCVPLQFLLDWKCEVGRAKDQNDIERIKEYLQRRQT